MDGNNYKICKIDKNSNIYSEMHQIEQAMLNDKMSMTDWERTEEDIKDQVHLYITRPIIHYILFYLYHNVLCPI